MDTTAELDEYEETAEDAESLRTSSAEEREPEAVNPTFARTQASVFSRGLSIVPHLIEVYERVLSLSLVVARVRFTACARVAILAVDL